MHHRLREFGGREPGPTRGDRSRRIERAIKPRVGGLGDGPARRGDQRFGDVKRVDRGSPLVGDDINIVARQTATPNR